MTRRPASPSLVTLLVAGAALAASAPAGRAQEGDASFESAAATARDDLQRSLEELAAERERIAEEKLPLERRLRELEADIVGLRARVDDANGRLDERSLELARSRRELEGREGSLESVLRLLGEYRRNWEPRLHLVELPRHRDAIEAAVAAEESADMPPADRLAAQAAVLRRATSRLEDLVGGTRLQGRAVGPDGRVADVGYALFGPVALYAEPGGTAGVAEQRLGSLEPSMTPLPGELAEAARGVVDSGRGSLPLDPTLGGAKKIASTEEGIVDHARKGGVVMIPILTLAGIALLLALWKWVQLSRVPRAPKRKVRALLDAVEARDFAAARERVRAVPGPTGEMLAAGVESLDKPRELVEEAMYEHALDTRLRLSSLLPFIAVAAAAAPLLGLLGTVTGIINTFKLITVFGTGDARTLSSGISEALVTTEFGLIVAIPALLLHAWLSRRAQGHVDDMEKVAVSFLNRIPTTPAAETATRDDAPTSFRDREGGRRLAIPETDEAAWETGAERA